MGNSLEYFQLKTLSKTAINDLMFALALKCSFLLPHLLVQARNVFLEEFCGDDYENFGISKVNRREVLMFCHIHGDGVCQQTAVSSG